MNIIRTFYERSDAKKKVLWQCTYVQYPEDSLAKNFNDSKTIPWLEAYSSSTMAWNVCTEITMTMQADLECLTV